MTFTDVIWRERPDGKLNLWVRKDGIWEWYVQGRIREDRKDAPYGLIDIYRATKGDQRAFAILDGTSIDAIAGYMGRCKSKIPILNTICAQPELRDTSYGFLCCMFGAVIGSPIGEKHVLKWTQDAAVDNTFRHYIRKKEMKEMSDNNPKNHEPKNLETAAVPKGVGSIMASALKDATATAVTTVAGQRAIKAGTKFLADQAESIHPTAGAILRSPGGQAVAGVLLPLLATTLAEYSSHPIATKLKPIAEAGLTAGTINAVDKVFTNLLGPMANVMLGAAEETEQVEE